MKARSFWTPLAGALLWVALLAGVALCAPAATAPAAVVAVEDGLVTLDARDADLASLLRTIAQQAGIALAVGEGVGGKVTLRLERVPLAEALRQLTSSRAILYEDDPATRRGTIVGAAAFAAGSRPAAGETPSAAPAPLAAADGSGAGAAAGSRAAASGPPPRPDGPDPAGAAAAERDSRGRPLYKSREILVRFRPEAATDDIRALHRELGSTVVREIGRLRLQRLRVRDGLAEAEAVTRYRASEIVAVAGRHTLRYPQVTPDDPYFAYNGQWALQRIGMPAAWEITTGSAEVVVAVIDTGVDLRHPDLAPNLLPGRDLAGASQTSETDADADPMDNNGHGTHVAGIIAAVGNNGIGIAGVGWKLKLLPLKILADDAAADMMTFDIIAAIDHLLVRGDVRVVNCSFGGEAPFDPLEREAFARLRDAGILAVCAAGNRGVDNDTSPSRIYPASYDLDHIVAVAASSASDALWGAQPTGSNYGLVSVDLMAPGDAIRGPNRCPATGACDSYVLRSGTSMAAPHVSGVAGLILSRNPGLSYRRVRSLLLQSVDRVGAVATKLASGGRLNAAAALAPVCLPGDLTGDGRIGLDDVLHALAISAGLDDGAGACATSDVDRNDRLGLAEAVHGLRVLSGSADMAELR